MNTQTLIRARCTALAVALVACSQTAVAQSTDTADTNVGKGDEIVVTSLRRPEALRNVGESITVFDGGYIDRSGIANLRDVADLTPNFGMLDNYRPGLERFQLRGIITPQVGDPPLTFVVDGITAPDPEFATQQLFDVERVEVLRGVQGALYGRSAVGGTVNIVSRAPTNAFEGWATASYQNGDDRRFSALLSGPIVQDKLYFRVGGYRNDGDGVIENVYLHTGADYTHDFGTSALLKAVIDPRTTFDLRGQYSKGHDGIGFYDAVQATTKDIDNFAIQDSQNVLGDNRHKTYQLSAKLAHDFDHATLTIAGSRSRTQDKGIADGDLVALPSDGVNFFPNWQYATDVITAWTVEARLASSGAGRFSWALGSFFQARRHLSLFSIYTDPSGTAPLTWKDLDPSLLQFAIMDNQHSRDWAISGEAGYEITDALKIDVAGRYDRDFRQSFDPRDRSDTFARATFDKFQPKVSLTYHFTPNVLAFASYSLGFRSGGFNQYAPTVPRSFGAETTRSYEVGIKGSALANRLTWSGALFRNDQTGAQITQFNPTTFTLQNVGIDNVRSQGVEVEAAMLLMRGVHARFNAGYTDSDIRAFAANPALVGDPMPYVPKFTTALSLEFDEPLNRAWHLQGEANYRVTGSRSYSLDFPDLRSGPHDFLDLRLGLANGRWTLTGFAKNLLNERQPEDLFGVFNGAVDLARQPNRPRRYGAELRYKFG